MGEGGSKAKLLKRLLFENLAMAQAELEAAAQVAPIIHSLSLINGFLRPLAAPVVLI